MVPRCTPRALPHAPAPSTATVFIDPTPSTLSEALPEAPFGTGLQARQIRAMALDDQHRCRMAPAIDAAGTRVKYAARGKATDATSEPSET